MTPVHPRATTDGRVLATLVTTAAALALTAAFAVHQRDAERADAYRAVPEGDARMQLRQDIRRDQDRVRAASATLARHATIDARATSAWTDRPLPAEAAAAVGAVEGGAAAVEYWPSF